MRKHKSDIPEEVLNYCIDNQLTVEEGLCSMIESRLDRAEGIAQELMSDCTKFKSEVTGLIDTTSVISAEEMDDVEDFLNGLDQ